MALRHRLALLGMAWEGTDGLAALRIRLPNGVHPLPLGRMAWRVGLPPWRRTARTSWPKTRRTTWQTATSSSATAPGPSKPPNRFLPDFDLDIQEDAFFHYAKLAFELSFNPFDDAIVAFESYLTQFPLAPPRRGLPVLLQVHMTSRDYERALGCWTTSPSRPNRHGRRPGAGLQPCRGVVPKQAARPALVFFRRAGPTTWTRKCMPRRFTGKVRSCTTKKVHACCGGVRQVQHHPGSYLSELHNDADYARGYAHFKSEKYTDALSAFRSYLETGPKTTLPGCATPSCARPTASTLEVV